MRLLVTEKPSVARDWARLLQARKKVAAGLCNDDIVITWCIGHVAQIADPEQQNPAWRTWRLNMLPMLPETFVLQPNRATAAHFSELKKLLLRRDIREVINGCDAGREGELIFRYAYALAGCTKPVLRLWLSSMTDTAMRAAMGTLRPARHYDHLADAARCRSEADWIVGLNATRALTLAQRRNKDAPLYTVGRVQTPTLAMLVTREDDIAEFEPEPYWHVVAAFHTPQAQYDGLYTAGDKTRIPSQIRANAIAEAVQQQAGRVVLVEHRDKVEPPPLLFDLTSLQRLANAKFGMRATDTLDAAQALYEKHKAITYPRTDANYLTSDMARTLPAIIKSFSQSPWDAHVQPLLQNTPLPIPKRVICDSEVGDHHAIIPTGRMPPLTLLTPPQRQIFDLIARRFIAAFYPPAIFALTTVRTQVGAHTFISRGRTCKQLGWQAVEPPRPPPKGAPGSDAPLLPDMATNTVVWAHKTRIDALKTQPPPRYSEGRLLLAMERAGGQLADAELRIAMKESGLGTPATRAAIIETLHRREFVQREDRVLVPTAKGRALIAALPKSSLTEAALTGAWEARLGQVARGKLAADAFMRDVRTFTQQIVADIVASTQTPAASEASGPPPTPAKRQATRTINITKLACPVCKQGHMMPGRAAWGCDRWRKGCKFVIAYQFMGHPLQPKDLRALLTRGQTAAQRGFRDVEGNPRAGRLVLDIRAPGFARLQVVQAKARSDARNAPSRRRDNSSHARDDQHSRR